MLLYEILLFTHFISYFILYYEKTWDEQKKRRKIKDMRKNISSILYSLFKSKHSKYTPAIYLVKDKK